MIKSNLIYDRTQTDVDNAKANIQSVDWSKGKYNEIDLNRVESKVRELTDALNVAGYEFSLTTKTDWTRADSVTTSQWSRYVKNLRSLKSNFTSLPTTPIPYYSTTGMSYTHANDYEQILYDLVSLYNGMYNNYIYCGVSHMGQSRTWQQRFRRKFSYVRDATWSDLTYTTWDEISDKDWRAIEHVITNE